MKRLASSQVVHRKIQETAENARRQVLGELNERVHERIDTLTEDVRIEIDQRVESSVLELSRELKGEIAKLEEDLKSDIEKGLMEHQETSKITSPDAKDNHVVLNYDFIGKWQILQEDLNRNLKSLEFTVDAVAKELSELSSCSQETAKFYQEIGIKTQ